MEDHRLRAFCLVVELQSFSKAAETKFMTQSAMSHLIRNLEDEIEAKLLNRSGKTVMPTPAGRQFYLRAKDILESYRQMEDEVWDFVRKIKGPLFIGTSTAVATHIMPQILYSFSKCQPDVEINLSVSNTEDVVKRLYDGKIEIGVVEGIIRDARIFLEEIAEDEIVLIASDTNPLTRKKALSPHDILNQPFIMPETGSGTREFIDDFFREININPRKLKVLMTIGIQELIVHLVQAGLGISFVSKWSVFKAIKEGSISVLRVGSRRLTRKFYLVSLDQTPSTVAAQTFRAFLKGYRFFAPF